MHTLGNDTYVFQEEIMSQTKVLERLEKGLRFLAVFTLLLMAFQTLGVLMYGITVWPAMAPGIRYDFTVIAGLAVAAALFRSVLWVRIYWVGAKVLKAHRDARDAAAVSTPLTRPLQSLTRMLVTSAALDVLFLPAIFLMDTFFPFTLASWQLGLVQMAVLMFPQVFGVAALVLAYLANQYGQWMKERDVMKKELELTI